MAGIHRGEKASKTRGATIAEETVLTLRGQDGDELEFGEDTVTLITTEDGTETVLVSRVKSGDDGAMEYMTTTGATPSDSQPFIIQKLSSEEDEESARGGQASSLLQLSKVPSTSTAASSSSVTPGETIIVHQDSSGGSALVDLPVSGQEDGGGYVLVTMDGEEKLVPISQLSQLMATAASSSQSSS